MFVTLTILVFIVSYAVRGYRRGLVLEAYEFVALVVAVVVAHLLWPFVGAILELLLPISDGWARSLGGTVTFLALLIGGLLLSRRLAARRDGRSWSGLKERGNGVGGSVFSVVWSLLLVTGFLLMAVTVPGARLRSAEQVCGSPVTRFLMSGGNPLHAGGERIADLGRPVLLWVSQQMYDSFTLDHDQELCSGDTSPDQLATTGQFQFPPAEAATLSPAPDAETRILELVNQARVEAGLEPLTADPPMADVGRAHATDMYVRGYFAHETPECGDGPAPDPRPEGCRDAFDRIHDAGLTYQFAGENLALAPTVDSVHQGLMDSPGHRANILSPDYTSVGIGVVQGPYGLMVTQEFRS